jgi:protein-S-isoprenylcysteine O-methyltransferase Ste14
VLNAALKRHRRPSHPATDETRLGFWIFRNRSWLPMPLVLALVAIKPDTVDPRRVYAGAALIVAGTALRLWAVRHIGVASRTRTSNLGPLVTSGPYAHTRNPLYMANGLLWTGFALASSLRWMVPVSWVVFAVQHVIVVRWEEQRLAECYVGSYRRYVRDVPRWWPRLSSDRTSPAQHRYSWIEVLFSERGTMVAIALVALLLTVRYLIA